MARGQNQKKKLPVLARLLLEYSDEDHPLSIQAMQEELARWDISAERKSIYDDMEQLRQMGMDIQSKKGKGGGWFVGQRDFELAELKLLVDAVQSSRFLTGKKSAALIHKLEGLTSRHQARQLQRQVYVDGRVKTMNESIFYNVDKLHEAISQGMAITFHYFEYNMYKEQVFRRGGGLYRAVPYGLLWDSENYYLAAWDEDNGELRHYRVDKMKDISKAPNREEGQKDWDPEGYTRRHFGMYSGRHCDLRLRCQAGLAGVVLDRFGRDLILIPDGEEHFTVTLDLVVSPPFWGWLFGLGAGVEVLSPQWAAEEFRSRLQAVAAVYQSRVPAEV